MKRKFTVKKRPCDPAIAGYDEIAVHHNDLQN